MINKEGRNFFEFSDKKKDLSKPIYNWLAQYDEEDDFLCEKVSNSLLEFAGKE
jgi:hypothetical protein